MYRILSATPTGPVDGHVDVSYTDRAGWFDDMGATILPIMVGDDHCGPFVVLSYVEPSEEQMPLSFAHAHASDNWRISVRGTTNMGRDTYEILAGLGLADITVDYVIVDTVRVPRETFASIFEAWRDGYVEPIVQYTSLSADQATAYFNQMIADIRNPAKYAVWMVPVVSARVP